MATYRYIKWEITESYGAAGGMIQVGELQLMSGGYDVVWNGSAVATNPDGDNPVGQGPQNAIDGTSVEKWLDFNFSGGGNVGNSVLVVDNGVDITFDSYYYVTAADSTAYPERNPISWTLYGSSDGTSWTALNSVTNATIPNLDETPTSVFTIVDATSTPTPTPSETLTPTPTPTVTSEPTPTPSVTVTSTTTPSSTPTPSVTVTPSITPSPSVTMTPSTTETPTPTPTPTPTSVIPTYQFSISPVLQGDIPFGLGEEHITPSNYNFSTGEKIWLNVSQQYYSFDYYEIHSPITIANSSYWYITYLGFTASFDPRTEVQLNTSSDIVGQDSLIIARYRA